MPFGNIGIMINQKRPIMHCRHTVKYDTYCSACAAVAHTFILQVHVMYSMCVYHQTISLRRSSSAALLIGSSEHQFMNVDILRAVPARREKVGTNKKVYRPCA